MPKKDLWRRCQDFHSVEMQRLVMLTFEVCTKHFYIEYLVSDSTIQGNYTKEIQNQQKVLKFMKTSPFSKNFFIESRFLNGITASLATISVSKRFHSKRI